MIVKYLASDCIVSGEVGFLKNLLETLSADTISEQIENWENEGSVYLGYFNAQILITQLKDKIEVILTNFVKDLILFFCNQTWNLFSLFFVQNDEEMGNNEEMVELDEIGPQLASLVVKIGGLPSKNAKDCLARAGMSFS